MKGLLLDWRAIYVGLLSAMAAIAFWSGYSPNYLWPIFGTAAFWLIILLAGKILFWLATERPETPLVYFLANARRLSTYYAGRTALFFSSILFFVWLPPLKTLIPKYAGFFADPYLASFDRVIFGRDPWELFHLVPFMAQVDWLYTLWVPKIVACSAWVAVSANTQVLRRFFLSWALCFWALGFALAMALASAGPIFAHDLGLGFDGLRPALSEARHAPAIADVLWRVHVTNSVVIGGGISAAPSMHCALTFLFALAMRGTVMFVPAVIYSGFVWFGSVYLGWHYFVDGLISWFGAVLIWKWSTSLGLSREIQRSSASIFGCQPVRQTIRRR